MILRRSIRATQDPAAFLLIQLIVSAGTSSPAALMIKVTEGSDG